MPDEIVQERDLRGDWHRGNAGEAKLLCRAIQQRELNHRAHQSHSAESTEPFLAESFPNAAPHGSLSSRYSSAAWRTAAAKTIVAIPPIATSPPKSNKRKRQPARFT